MKHVKLFDGFINEKIAYPEGVKSTGDKILDKFAKLINSPSGTVNVMSWAVQGRSIPFMTGPESFSVTGNSSEDFYVINTSKGKFKLTKKDIKKGEELYDEVESIVQTGKPKRSVMESLNEGLTDMKHIKLFEQFVTEAKTDIFPEYNNGLEANEYEKQLIKALSSVKGVGFNMSSTSMIYLRTEPNMADKDSTKDIQKALKGFDDNLDLDKITSNIGKPGQISQNDQQKGIVSYTIPKKVDWWTLKRAAGPEKPSTETVLTDEIISSILDRMAQVSTTQDQLANTAWTSLEDLLRAAEDHMSGTNYKKFYKEIKKKYPKIK